MVKEIMKDPTFLSLRSESATKDDIKTGEDLLDTLAFHKDECVGMAANMIGVRKRIMVFLDESGKKPEYTVMYNPEIIAGSGRYGTEEGCLSLPGQKRKCLRFKKIKVRYQNVEFQTRIKTYEGFTAEIIQHEADHFEGILI